MTTTNDHGERGHSHVGASGYYRWSICPGSVVLGQKFENRSSFYAAEGTVAHELGETCLEHGYNAKRYLGNVVEKEGFKIEVTQEMVDAVNTYADSIRSEYKPGDVMFIEAPFHLDHLHPSCFGTNDAAIYKPRDRMLTVYDLKYGAGIEVSPVDNAQLKYYGLGALHTLQKQGKNTKVDTVELVIIQPRGREDEPVKRWSCDILHLMEFAGELVDAVERTEEPNPEFSAGDHCRFCPASAECPELRARAYKAALVDFS